MPRLDVGYFVSELPTDIVPLISQHLSLDELRTLMLLRALLKKCSGPTIDILSKILNCELEKGRLPLLEKRFDELTQQLLQRSQVISHGIEKLKKGTLVSLSPSNGTDEEHTTISIVSPKDQQEELQAIKKNACEGKMYFAAGYGFFWGCLAFYAVVRTATENWTPTSIGSALTAAAILVAIGIMLLYKSKRFSKQVENFPPASTHSTYIWHSQYENRVAELKQAAAPYSVGTGFESNHF